MDLNLYRQQKTSVGGMKAMQNLALQLPIKNKETEKMILTEYDKIRIMQEKHDALLLKFDEEIIDKHRLFMKFVNDTKGLTLLHEEVEMKLKEKIKHLPKEEQDSLIIKLEEMIDDFGRHGIYTLYEENQEGNEKFLEGEY